MVSPDWSGQCDVGGWTDIVEISAERYHTVGLKSNGTVVAVGWNEQVQCNVAGWTDIVAICAGSEHTLGLKGNGTVVVSEYSGVYDGGHFDLSGWKNIKNISIGFLVAIGVKSDGTLVIADGDTSYGKSNVSSWTNIKLPQ